MLNAQDKRYYNVSGVLMYDPAVGAKELATSMTVVPFVDYWKGLHPFNDSFVNDIRKRHQTCGYADHINKYLTYPPPGPQPVLPASQDECRYLWDDVVSAATLVNPCYDFYQVATTCPLLWDVLGCGAERTSLPRPERR